MRARHLYTKIRRNGMQMYVCTGIKVDIKEWNKAQKSLSAMQRYEQTEAGAKVHELQMQVMKAVDALYAEGKINTKKDRTVKDTDKRAEIYLTEEEQVLPQLFLQ